MSTIAVTGGRGFIGSHVISFLRSQGFTIVSLIRPTSLALEDFEVQIDLTDGDELRSCLKRIAPRFVLHFASRVLPGRGNFDIRGAFENEVLTATTLAEAIPLDTELALFMGSCEEYGDSKPPFVEEQTLRAFSTYGWGKIAAHYGVSLVANERGLNWTWIRPFLTFGEGQETNSVIPSVVRACLAGERLELTAGEQTRDFIYVGDLCQMLGRILKSPSRARGETINLCSANPRSVRSVGEAIQKIIGQGELLWGALPYRNREAMSFYGSGAKFESLYGEFKLSDFEHCLHRVIEHARSQSTQAPR